MNRECARIDSAIECNSLTFVNYVHLETELNDVDKAQSFHLNQLNKN